jgi:hypothetical protein
MSNVKEGPFAQDKTADSIALDAPTNIPVQFLLPVQTANAIYIDAKEYADNAIRGMEGHLSSFVTWALESWNVPIPAQSSDPIDFWDQARAQLENVVSLLPAAPTITPINAMPDDPPAITFPALPDAVDIPDFAYEAADIDEDALWNRAKDREMIKLNALIADTRRDFDTLGFTMPQGSLVKAVDVARMNYQMVMSDLNREIPLKALEVYKARADVYRTVVEGKKAQIEALASQYKTHVDALMSEIQLYESGIKAFAVKMDVLKSNNLIAAEVFKAQVSGYAAEVGAISEAGKVAIEAADLQYKAGLEVMTQNIEIARLRLQEIIEQNKLKITAETAIGDIYRNIAASALSAMHMTADLKASSSYDVNFGVRNDTQYTVTQSDQYQENLALDEDD